MVKKTSTLHKKAFTMIELIFAIVIIAISVISLPMMIQTTSKGIENNIVQEAIFATGAILNESTSYYWDKHSLDDANISSGYSRVINTGDCSNTIPSKRVGHINRQCLDNNNTSPDTIGDNTSVEWVANTYNNIPILQGVGTGAESYKNIYYATAIVTQCIAGNTFIQFGQEANNPNLKQIKLTISNAAGDSLIVLRAYTANIGEVKPESRIF